MKKRSVPSLPVDKKYISEDKKQKSIWISTGTKVIKSMSRQWLPEGTVLASEVLLIKEIDISKELRQMWKEHYDSSGW